MSFFHRGKRGIQVSDTNTTTVSGHRSIRFRSPSRSSTEWRTAKYKKLTDNQKESLDRILLYWNAKLNTARRPSSTGLLTQFRDGFLESLLSS
jgi:hypothetical protein